MAIPDLIRIVRKGTFCHVYNDDVAAEAAPPSLEKGGHDGTQGQAQSAG